MPETALPDLMTVTEVADYLRIKQRTIYELVRTGRIPHTKLSGKLLFPRQMIEQWVAQSADGRPAAAASRAAPPVIAGSHDPLIEWSLRESDCGLAMLSCGSLPGIERFARGEVVATGTHLIDQDTGTYEIAKTTAPITSVDFVVIEWARREQGLVVAQGNPKSIRQIKDLRGSKVRLVPRQEGAGATALLAKLARDAGIDPAKLNICEQPARTETDVAVAIREGTADAGLAVRAAANAMALDFEPLHWERFDLVVRRFDYFEPPFQKLMRFVQTEAFRNKAAKLGGYDVGQCGRVLLNPRR